MAYDYKKLADSAKKAADVLKGKGQIASIKISRYQKQIKAVEVSFNGKLDDLLKAKGFKGKLSDLTAVEEKNISGKYKAKLFTVVSASNTLNKNDSFFIVNTFTEKGSIKTKYLAPDKLGLTSQSGAYVNVRNFDKAVIDGINYLTINEDIRYVLHQLYGDVVQFKSKNSDTIPFSSETKKLVSLLKSQDKQAIGKDFGEVLSLRWYITQSFAQPVERFGFTINSNNPLVDFYVRHGKTVSNVSAKFEAGAAPSINSIVKVIDKVYQKPTTEEKKAINVLKALASDKDNTSAKILHAYEALNLPTLNELKLILNKKQITIKDISEHIENIATVSNKTPARIKLFKEIYAPVYQILNKTASDDSLNTVFSSSKYSKYYSLVMSPMGYALVDYMNKTPIYQEILNNISRSLKTEQVYLNFTSSGMKFEKKLFSKAEFKFAYGANAKDSDNTGIKFSMK